jgi:large subunit ribosomal protein L15
MDLGTLKPAPGATRERRRVGRGTGSGLGKTAGRGHKGKGARSGGNTPPGYEGGQMPLQRRLPKRGFRPLDRTEYVVVNLRDLAAFPAGDTVTPDALRARGLIRKRGDVKVLGTGELPHALTVHAHAFSTKAREAITAAGGSVTVLGEAAAPAGEQ